MKKLAILPAVLLVLSAVVLAQSDITVPITSPIGPGNSGPQVFLSARALDIGIDTDGTGSSINPTDFRPGNYAFAGERIIYVVVVRDQNGVDDIENVHWIRDGDLETICTDVTSAITTYGSDDDDPWYCFDQDRGELITSSDVGGGNDGTTYCNDHGEIEIEIDTSTNLQWDEQIDKLYKCVLEVETLWSGLSNIAVHATDKGGLEGQTLSQKWNFNPPLIVDVITSDDEPLAFGNPLLDQAAVFATSPNCVNEPTDGPEDLTYRDCSDYVACDNNEVNPEDNCASTWEEKLCDISFSTNKIIITNVGEVNLWTFIASEDFHATEGAAKCPYDNTLSANQFEYRATSGSYDSGWRLMPEYSPNLQCAGIGLGDSVGVDVLGQCRGGCRIAAGGPGTSDGGAQTNPPLPGLDILSPTHTIEVALKLVWPTPCIGNFDNGNIHVLIRAV